MIKKIIKYPSPSLRWPCKAVDLKVDDPAILAEHANDLNSTLQTMANGVALASNQILEQGYRMFVTKPSYGLPLLVINPKWYPAGDISTVNSEGCLSIPELYFPLARHEEIKLAYDDTHGERHEIRVSGFAARIVQHECDHLDGKLIISHLPKSRQTEIYADVIRKRKAGR